MQHANRRIATTHRYYWLGQRDMWRNCPVLSAGQPMRSYFGSTVAAAGAGRRHVAMSTRGADTTTARHGPPATVKIIETVHIEADSAEFKSVVQRLTGKDAVAGGVPGEGRGGRRSTAVGWIPKGGVGGGGSRVWHVLLVCTQRREVIAGEGLNILIL
uniref:VQ domain-containing protein n=1 Tax=Oryza brachyantha TaxID=4533 RepID=J3L2F2_ORYBR